MAGNGSRPRWAAMFLTQALEYRGEKCLIWPYSRNQNGQAKIKRKGRRTPEYVGRIICTEIHGDPPTRRHESSHNCGNGHLGCVNPMHLEWKTHRQNLLDKIAHGTMVRGERHHNAKLTRADVRKIRKLIANGKLMFKEIAERFDVDPETIGAIAHGRSWVWLK